VRSVAIQEFGGPEKVKLSDRPRPKPGRGEVLIHTVAASVNPIDWKIREGLLKDVVPHAFPIVLGCDVAGIVEELGEGVARLRKGDKVWAYARKPVVQWGTWAEYVAVPETSAALLPPRLLFEEAAAVPCAALTAYQALRKGGLKSGDVVLVHGAAGGVGHFAVQFARNAGAKVLGSAGPINQEFVLGMGATSAIDYTREDLRETVKRLAPEGVSLVLDCVGGETLQQSFGVLGSGGRLVSIVERPSQEEAARLGVRADLVLAEPSAELLELFAGLAPRGKLKPHVSKIHPLADAAKALEESRAGHVRGKLVLAL